MHQLIIFTNFVSLTAVLHLNAWVESPKGDNQSAEFEVIV